MDILSFIPILFHHGLHFIDISRYKYEVLSHIEISVYNVSSYPMFLIAFHARDLTLILFS